jgi:hypothetical protein
MIIGLMTAKRRHPSEGGSAKESYMRNVSAWRGGGPPRRFPPPAGYVMCESESRHLKFQLQAN